MTDGEYRETAIWEWRSTDVAVDPDAVVEQVDGGAWVAARVFVSEDEVLK